MVEPGWQREAGWARGGFMEHFLCVPGLRLGLRCDPIFQMWEERHREGENLPRVTQHVAGSGP